VLGVFYVAVFTLVCAGPWAVDIESGFCWLRCGEAQVFIAGHEVVSASGEADLV